MSVPQSPRIATGLVAAAAVAAGLILGAPSVWDAENWALSVLSLCSDSKELEADVHNLLKQNQFFSISKKNVENLFL